MYTTFSQKNKKNRGKSPVFVHYPDIFSIETTAPLNCGKEL